MRRETRESVEKPSKKPRIVYEGDGVILVVQTMSSGVAMALRSDYYELYQSVLFELLYRSFRTSLWKHERGETVPWRPGADDTAIVNAVGSSAPQA
jgi:hypothetical protein